MKKATTPWRVTLNAPRTSQGERSIYLRARRTVDGRVEEHRISTGTTDAAEAERIRATRETEMNLPGFVYFVRNTRTRSVKVGWSNDPQARLAMLQVACEDTLVLEATIPADQTAERRFHRMLAACRIRGEWFRGDAVDLLVTSIATGMAPPAAGTA